MIRTHTASVPWTGIEIDPEIVLARVRCLFPGVTVWAGEFTGSYWALLGDGLHEFKDPLDLVTCLHANVPLPRPAPPDEGPRRPAPPRSRRAPVPRRRSWWRRMVGGGG